MMTIIEHYVSVGKEKSVQVFLISIIPICLSIIIYIIWG
jgi:hypothetical protein